MASFAGVAFRVVPDGSFYPQPVEENGVTKYTCEAWFASNAARNSMASKVSVVTELRSLGTKSVTIIVDSGYGEGDLRIPVYGGAETEVNAVLTGMTDTRGYGRQAVQQATAKLEFIIVASTNIVFL